VPVTLQSPHVIVHAPALTVPEHDVAVLNPSSPVSVKLPSIATVPVDVHVIGVASSIWTSVMAQSVCATVATNPPALVPHV
jgi:hypothetical protein